MYCQLLYNYQYRFKVRSGSVKTDFYIVCQIVKNRDDRLNFFNYYFLRQKTCVLFQYRHSRVDDIIQSVNPVHFITILMTISLNYKDQKSIYILEDV